jgi:hypothetical protein
VYLQADRDVAMAADAIQGLAVIDRQRKNVPLRTSSSMAHLMDALLAENDALTAKFSMAATL